MTTGNPYAASAGGASSAGGADGSPAAGYRINVGSVRVGAPGNEPLAGVGRLVSTRSTECRPTAYMVGATEAAVVVVPAGRAAVLLGRATVVGGVVVGVAVLAGAVAALEAAAVVGAAGDTVEPELLHPPV